MYKETSIRLSAEFSVETLQAKREQDDVFKVLEEKKICQPRILYLEKVSFRIEEETVFQRKAEGINHH